MSRLREIERRLGREDAWSNALSVPKETAELWPRFIKVKGAILTALTSQTSQTRRKLDTFSWSGVDSGIHDHRGQVKGVINGIELELDIEGTTVDDQAQVVVDKDGQWEIVHSKAQYMEVYGTFTSADRRRGAVKIEIGNADTPFEAYWLQIADGRLRLEQVVHGKDVFDTESFGDGKDQVNIPGTRIVIPRFIED